MSNKDKQSHYEALRIVKLGVEDVVNCRISEGHGSV